MRKTIETVLILIMNFLLRNIKTQLILFCIKTIKSLSIRYKSFFTNDKTITLLYFCIEFGWEHSQQWNFRWNIEVYVKKMRPVLWSFLKKKRLNTKITFKKNSLCSRLPCDGECRCEQITEKHDEKTGKICHQKSAMFCYYIRFDWKHNFPSGSHLYFRDVCRNWFVWERQQLDSKLYTFFNETKIWLKMGGRAGNKIKMAKNVCYLEKKVNQAVKSKTEVPVIWQDSREGSTSIMWLKGVKMSVSNCT